MQLNEKKQRKNLCFLRVFIDILFLTAEHVLNQIRTRPQPASCLTSASAPAQWHNRFAVSGKGTREVEMAAGEVTVLHPGSYQKALARVPGCMTTA